MKRIYLNSLPNPLLQQLAKHSQLRVISPTPQAARALRVPTQNLETLAQQSLLKKGFRPAPVLIARRALHAAVGKVIQTSDIDGTARTLTPALKAVLRAGIDLDALEAVASSRIQQLARLARAYQANIRVNRLVDSAEVLWRAAELESSSLSVFVYGYFHPRMDELAFLNAVSGNGSVMILPCPNHATFADIQEAVGWLRQQGWQVEASDQFTSTFSQQLQACFIAGTAAPFGVQSHIYTHIEAEVRGVLTQVKNLLSEGVAANEIVLVARDDAFYGPTVLDVAWEYDLRVRALYAVPIVNTRLGAWVQLLLEVVREFPFESTAKLLSHPLCLRLPAEVWSEAQKIHPSGLWPWQSLGVDLSLLDWPQQDTRSNWVQRLQDVLNRFDLRQRTGRWAREIVAFYKLQEGLVDLAKPEEESISLEEFTRDVSNSLALLSVPAQPGRGGVELHTPLSLFGASYKHVFVLGAAEGVLPAPVQDDPVLDFHERKLLIQSGFRFEGAAQAARREVVSFYALLQTATTTLTFSYPQLMGSEASLPSPYLGRLGLEPVPPPPLPVSSIEQVRRIYLRRDGCLDDPIWSNIVHAWAVEKRREGADPYDEYDGVVGLPIPTTRIFSASQLTALGQCPFKWFADKVLGLTELKEAEEDLSPRLKGNLYHRSLELAFKVLGATDLCQTVEKLKVSFLQAEQDLEFPTLPAWNARRSEHIKVLSRAVQGADFLQPSAEILSLETDFEGEWYGLKVRGRMDRIDRTPQGLVLLDYKTSSQPPIGVKDDFGKASLDIQLPLYIYVAQTILFPGEQVEGAYYYSLTKGKKLYKAQPNEQTLKEIARRVKAHLETGDYPVDPDIEQQACRYCPYDLICRKGVRNSRKGGAV